MNPIPREDYLMYSSKDDSATVRQKKSSCPIRPIDRLLLHLLEPIGCKKRKKVPAKKLVWGIGDL